MALAAAPSGAGSSGPRYGMLGWSGYAWHPASRMVTASMRLPNVRSDRKAGAAFWTGFGTGPGIEQTGFTANMVNGHLSWTSWYELYPAPPVGFGRAARSGDLVSMTVVYGGRGWFTLTVHDKTAHWSAAVRRHAGTVTLNTAEVVVEAYGPPLARFSPVRFTGVPARHGWLYRMPGTHLSSLGRHGFSVHR
jgi:hypothetical protein